MFDEWRSEVVKLNLLKRYQESGQILREQAKAGNISAYEMLARIGTLIGITRVEVDRLVWYVEENMDAADIDAHIESHAAYDQRLGAIPYEQTARLSFDHLLAAAELGAGAIYSLAVARILRSGALMVDQNFVESERWYKRAIEQGSVEAMHEIQELHKRVQGKVEKKSKRL